jgi:hypothetical protein
MVLIWWVITAEPTTVYHTLRYDFSNIDDHRIFPGRRLSPVPQPFRFREQLKPAMVAIPVWMRSSHR